MAPNRRRPAVGGPGAGGEHTRRGAPRQYSHDTPAARILGRLDAVRETGPGRWSARCPAHDDRHPSLTIRETPDGTLLVRCWAGCDVGAVVESVGLQLADLFPPRRDGHGGPPLAAGERWVPRDVLAALAGECTVVVAAAEQLARGEPLADADLDRLRQAAVRIGRAADEVAP